MPPRVILIVLAALVVTACIAAIVWSQRSKQNPPSSDLDSLSDLEISRLARDMAVVEELIKEGDLLKQPREVEHWLLFDSEHNRDCCMAVVQAMGYQCEVLTPDEELPELIGFSATHVSAVDVDTIHKSSWELVQVAQKHNGEYDGWETFVIRPDP